MKASRYCATYCSLACLFLVTVTGCGGVTESHVLAADDPDAEPPAEGSDDRTLPQRVESDDPPPQADGSLNSSDTEANTGDSLINSDEEAELLHSLEAAHVSSASCQTSCRSLATACNGKAFPECELDCPGRLHQVEGCTALVEAAYACIAADLSSTLACDGYGGWSPRCGPCDAELKRLGDECGVVFHCQL